MLIVMCVLVQAREIPWLRSVTKMEIWIKGVLTAEDTLMAVQTGCDGIIVSPRPALLSI